MHKDNWINVLKIFPSPLERQPGYGSRQMERVAQGQAVDLTQFDVTTISDKLKEGITCHYCENLAVYKCMNPSRGWDCVYDGKGNPQGILVCDHTSPGPDHYKEENGRNGGHWWTRLDSGNVPWDEDSGHWTDWDKKN
tara:strand:+ start:215 stop:628 length:414 start_codon:yes stop_codon:yes gene_type:complete